MVSQEAVVAEVVEGEAVVAVEALVDEVADEVVEGEEEDTNRHATLVSPGVKI